MVQGSNLISKMNNILILRESEIIGKENNWKYLTKLFSAITKANLVILIKNDETYKLIRNKNGSNGLIGKFGELLDIDTFFEPVDLGIEI